MRISVPLGHIFDLQLDRTVPLILVPTRAESQVNRSLRIDTLETFGLPESDAPQDHGSLSRHNLEVLPGDPDRARARKNAASSGHEKWPRILGAERL
jgi:hypothetical protein